MKVLSIILFITSIFSLAFAQETYNLEILFQRTNWEPDTIVYSYGYSMSTVGDLNQDGFDDFIYLVYYFNVGDKGFIYFGGPTMDTIPDIILRGEEGELGCVCSGDLDGDGINDIIIGQPSGGNGYGVAQIYFGSATMDSLPDIILRGENHASEFGISVACGDVNGDSADDLIVGAYAYPGMSIHGRVYVYYGGALLDTLPDVIIDGYNNESKGITVGSGGDVNDDGYEDIVIGAFNNSEAGIWAGKVYVFHGGNPMDTIPDCWMHGEGGGQSLGWFGGDILKVENTYDIVVTSTPFCGGGSYGRGKVYVLNGGDSMDSLPDIWMIGENDSSSLGMWCCSAGDVDGDGNDDLLAGAPCDYAFFGCGYVWLGGISMDREPDAYLKGEFFWQSVGWKTASAGDVDGDSQDEIMFSNYAGVDPSVWVCKYTGPGIGEYDNTIQNSDVQIHPNPFSSVLKISLHNSMKTKNIFIRIYDVAGREVMYNEIEYECTSIVINTKALSRGVYFIHVSGGSETITTKVVKVQ